MKNRTLGMLALVAALAGCRSKTACDADAVQVLAGELEAADERERPDIVVPGIAKACRIPWFLDSYFGLFRPRDRFTLRRMSDEEIAARAELMDRACPKAPGVMKTLSDLPYSQRSPLFYDRCELARFGVLDRDEYLRAEQFPVPWMLHQFMLENGVDEASARVVTRAMFTAERKLFEHDRQLEAKVEVPRVAAPLFELPEGIRVEISADAVRLNEEELVSLRGRDLSGAELRHALLSGLGPDLAEEIDRTRGVHTARGRSDEPRLRIYADVRSSVEIVMWILYMAKRRGIEDVALIVETGPYYYGALPLESAPLGPPPGEEGEPNPPWPEQPPLRVVIDDTGELELIEPRRERIDLAQLSATAATFCADGPESRFAVIEPRAGVTVAELVEVMLELRGPACGDSRDGACCFVNVGLDG